MTSEPPVRIVEVSAFVAAPLAGMTLAGLGCEVVRVDPPGGGLDFARWPVTASGDSLFWAGLNRGKRSVVIDFRREEGRELVSSMVAAGGEEGGVFLTNLGAKGTLRHDALSERRPGVISVEIHGYPDGRSAVDYTISAETGIPLMTGPQGHVGPVNSPLPTWDIATGLSAAMGTREALWRRERTGVGAHVRIALADVALGLLASLGFLDEEGYAVEPRRRDGNYLYGSFGRDFLLADGARIMVVALTGRQWRALVAALGLAEEIKRLEGSSGLDLDREGDRFRLRREVSLLVERWCATRSLVTAAKALDAHGVCWSLYGSASNFADTAAARKSANNATVAASSAGLVHDIGLPVRLGEAPLRPLGPAPDLGQDTEDVLSELLGLSAYELGGLYDKGIIASPGGARRGDRA